MKTGIKDFDNTFGGLNNSVSILEGYAGSGKTSLVLNMISSMTKLGHKVTYIAMEYNLKDLEYLLDYNDINIEDFSSNLTFVDYSRILKEKISTPKDFIKMLQKFDSDVIIIDSLSVLSFLSKEFNNLDFFKELKSYSIETNTAIALVKQAKRSSLDSDVSELVYDRTIFNAQCFNMDLYGVERESRHKYNVTLKLPKSRADSVSLDFSKTEIGV